MKAKSIYCNDELKRIIRGNFFLIVSIVVAFVLFILMILCFKESINFTNKKVISYKEIGDIDYRVYLNRNDNYDESFLQKDLQYKTDFINTINVRFNYKIKTDEDLSYKYKILYPDCGSDL